MHNHIIFSIFLIFCGAAVVATLALYTRQSLVVAYIALGVLLGPWGMKLVSDPVVLKDIGDIGIIFLLFLLGLNLQPQNLWKMLRETTIITCISSLIFAVIGYAIAIMADLPPVDALIVGTCMMFSSTIIGLKLLPTTVLHHQRTGEIVISILLLQDIIAIFTLLLLNSLGSGKGLQMMEVIRTLVAMPILFLIAFFAERYILMKVAKRFNRIHEYLFLIAIGWCLGLGELAEMMNLSFEIGAFIAGISIAQSPISRFIAESLRPLRDFFLILFFFSLGAKINLAVLRELWIWTLVLGLLFLLIKPIVFQPLLRHIAASSKMSWEVGVRLGQISEFSLLVAYTAERNHLIGQDTYSLIQAATIITFIVSSYWVVNRFPNPIAVSDKLRRD